jgi:undecaprenyl-phosphate 4-deoxy-4-formamido-L-arabinose transferase
VHYPAIHRFALYRKLGWKDGDFPHAERAGRNLLTLPLFPAMTPADVARVVRPLSPSSPDFRLVLEANPFRNPRKSMKFPLPAVRHPALRGHPGLQRGANLPALFARLYPVLDALGRPYEIIFTNDGSHDRSFALLQAQHAARPDVTRVIDFNANYGQHMAIMAAFERVRGEVIVTLDADLQNPPEEIPKLLEKIDAGHDYVGGCRLDRQDSFFRTHGLEADQLRPRADHQHRDDRPGLHAARLLPRQVVDAVVRSGAINTFIPALAYSFSSSPTEVGVKHEERHAGRLELFVLQADPPQLRPHHRLLAGAAAVLHDVRNGLLGRQPAARAGAGLPPASSWAPRTDGVFTLFGILFFLLSVAWSASA